MKQLTVVSSYANDKLIDPGGRVISIQPGGPARFISDALGKLSKVFSYEVICGDTIEVEILLVPGQGEFGRILFEGLGKQLPVVETANLLISTLAKEWDVTILQNYRGRVFLDAQGFVRDTTGGFGRKQMWPEVSEIAAQLFCVKATEEETSFLPEEFVHQQKIQRCLLVTKGSQGVDVFFKGQEWHEVPAGVVINSSDTVGAGDTFLANFTAEFILAENIKGAVKNAMTATEKFLLGKTTK